MDIHQLKVFLAVYKNRSFSKASEELHLTQPTISDHIKSLEEELNCRLFDRLGRTIIPTREAELLYDHAIEIIERIEKTKEVLNRFQTQPSGEITIGASTIPGTYLLPHIIKEFRKEYPHIECRVLISDSRDIFERIISHKLFLGIIGARLSNSQILYTSIGEDKLIIVGSPSIIKKTSHNLEDLLSYPFILREEGSGTRREMEKILTAKGLNIEDLRIAGIFGSTEAVKEAVKAGLGIAVLSELSVKEDIKRGVLKEIRIPGLEMKRDFYIIQHKKRTVPYLYKLFLDTLKGKL